jgi:hypothetical protein
MTQGDLRKDMHEVCEAAAQLDPLAIGQNQGDGPSQTCRVCGLLDGSHHRWTWAL